MALGSDVSPRAWARHDANSRARRASAPYIIHIEILLSSAPRRGEVTHPLRQRALMPLRGNARILSNIAAMPVASKHHEKGESAKVERERRKCKPREAGEATRVPF